MRIISGSFKGKKILQPKDQFTRPLKDLTKESLFNILMHSKKFNHNLRIALDLKYQKANNICLDIYILFKTVLSVLRGKSY